VAQAFAKTTQYQALNTIQAKPGDVVNVQISESALLRASMLMYLMPIILMIVFALFASILFTQTDLAELYSVLSGGCGLAVGIILFKFYAGKWLKDFQQLPVLASQAPSKTTTLVRS
jgi:sigma-E factor negative regulatory protein RseC